MRCIDLQQPSGTCSKKQFSPCTSDFKWTSAAVLLWAHGHVSTSNLCCQIGVPSSTDGTEINSRTLCLFLVWDYYLEAMCEKHLTVFSGVLEMIWEDHFIMQLIHGSCWSCSHIWEGIEMTFSDLAVIVITLVDKKVLLQLYFLLKSHNL